MRMLTPYLTNRSLTSDLFSEMDRFFEDFNRWTPNRVYDERSFDPACEVSESDDGYFMSVDLPGMKKEDIKIEIANNMLMVSGERKRETSTGKKQKLQHYEKSYGFFKRSFSLPTSVEVDKVEANYEDGVLELYLPKIQSAKPRHIEIQTGKTGLFNKLLGSKKDEKNVQMDVDKSKVS